MQAISKSFSCCWIIFFVTHICSVSRLDAQTNSISFTNRQGEVYENISIIKVDKNGLQYRYSQGIGGGNIKLGDLPDDVVRKFGFDPAVATAHDERQKQEDKIHSIDKAVASGVFRDVGGIVYDMRKNQAGWMLFQGAKMLQRLENGEALVSVPYGGSYGGTALHLKHLAAISDTEVFNFRGKQIGTYDYINQLGDSRSVRSYDLGRVCARDEIPPSVLNGDVAFARVLISGNTINEVLPSNDVDSLVATGTGFFITDDGYLVTNNHVVDGAKKVRIRLGSRTMDAQVVKTSRVFDLAILKVEGTFKSLPLEFESKINLGDSVFTIGFPNLDIQGAAPKYTDGKISSLSGMADDPSQYQISVPIQPGNSGGPLIAENGGVVGIVRAKMNDLTAIANSGSVPQNVNYAVKAKYLKDVLDEVPAAISKIKVQTSAIKDSDAVKVAQEAVAIILVY